MNYQYQKVVATIQHVLNVDEKAAKDLISSLNFAKIVELNSAVKADDIEAVRTLFAVQEADNAFSSFSQPSRANSFSAATNTPAPAGQQQTSDQETAPVPGDQFMKGNKLTLTGPDGTKADVEVDQAMPNGVVKVKNDKGYETIDVNDLKHQGGTVEVNEDATAGSTSAGSVASAPHTITPLISRKMKKDATPD